MLGASTASKPPMRSSPAPALLVGEAPRGEVVARGATARPSAMNARSSSLTRSPCQSASPPSAHAVSTAWIVSCASTRRSNATGSSASSIAAPAARGGLDVALDRVARGRLERLPADPQRSRSAARGALERRRRAAASGRLARALAMPAGAAARRAQRELEVVDAACEQPRRVERGGGRQRPGQRHDAEGRLEAEHAAVGGRAHDRAGGLRAGGERHHAARPRPRPSRSRSRPACASRSSGLRVSVGCMKANSQVLVLPTITAPAASSSTTSAASARGRWPR